MPSERPRELPIQRLPLPIAYQAKFFQPRVCEIDTFAKLIRDAGRQISTLRSLRSNNHPFCVKDDFQPTCQAAHSMEILRSKPAINVAD